MAKGVHWVAPATMLGSLAAGVLFAAGHHIFYHSLAGQEAPSGNYTVGSLTFSKQEANITLGIALAFLVKAALAIAVVTAYIQLFWQAVLRRKPDRGTPLSHLNVTWSVTSNFFDLLRVDVWWTRPFSLLLAIIAW